MMHLSFLPPPIFPPLWLGKYLLPPAPPHRDKMGSYRTHLDGFGQRPNSVFLPDLIWPDRIASEIYMNQRESIVAIKATKDFICVIWKGNNDKSVKLFYSKGLQRGWHIFSLIIGYRKVPAPSPNCCLMNHPTKHWAGLGCCRAFQVAAAPGGCAVSWLILLWLLIFSIS